jgi:putative toxin-antitoxin system antitoxin component (TIGR02293 family)
MTTAHLQEIVLMLGLKGDVRSYLEIMPMVREGLPFRAMERVAKALALSVDDTAQSLGLARRTMARRKTMKTLDTSESERVVRLARSFTRATSVLGSREKARRWFQKPNRALRNEAPLSMLDTDIGAQAVEDALTRIEHGVFA